MDLFEYQARDLLKSFDLPVTDGILITEQDFANSARFDELVPQTYPVVVKAQVKVGGRGKAGGVKLAQNEVEFRKACTDIMGLDIKGYTVQRLYVVPAAEIVAEYYVSLMFDRSAARYLLMLSKQGGMDIEDLAVNHPDELVKVHFDAVTGLTPSQTAQAVENAGFTGTVAAEVSDIILKLWQAYQECDATLVEINPLALVRSSDGTGDERVEILDAKVSLDGNASFRHIELYDKYNTTENTDPLEIRAKELDIAYVHLDGEVGIIGNGAGLVMSTLDLVSIYGKGQGSGGTDIKPANFLDIGGGASAQHMQNAMELVLANPNVKSLFINIFGGLTQGSLVAAGIISAVNAIGTDNIPPISVRLSGNEAELGIKALRSASIAQISAFPDQISAANNAIREATNA